MALKLGELVAELSADAKKLDSGLAEGRSKLASFGGAATKLLAAGGVAAGAAFISSTMMAVDRQQIAADAAAAYGDPVVAAKAGKVAGALYNQGWGDSLEEVNDSVNAVITSISDMAGASEADIGKMSSKLMDVSRVMKLDVGRTAQIVGQMVKTGLAKNSTEGLDMFTAALQKVPANVREDLTDAIDEYGPFFQTLGIKGDQAFGMLVKASEKGMYGIDKTGDALKEFTLRASDGSDQTGAAFKSIGLNADQMARGIAVGGESGARALQKTVNGLLSIDDPAKRAQAAIALFGTPLEDLNVSEIPKFLTSLQAGKSGLGDFAGAADKLSATVNNTAATNIESFKRQVTSAFVDLLGARVLPIVQAASGYLATNFGPGLQRVGEIINGQVIPALQASVGFVERNSLAFQIVAGVLAAVFLPALIAMAIQAGITAVATGAAWVLMQAKAIASIAIQSGQIVFMIGRMLFMGAMSLVAGAQVALGWLLALGPIGLLIAAVALAVGLIIANWGRVKGWLGTFWGWMKAGWRILGSYIIDAVMLFTLGPTALIVRHWSTVKGWLGSFWGWLKGAFNAGAHAIVAAARLGFLGPVPMIIARWGDIKSFFSGLPGKIIGILEGMAGRMYSAGANMIRALARGLESQASAAVQKVRNMVSDIASLIPGSPVKRGPLRSLNNGRAGREIARMLAGGISAEGRRVGDAMSGILDAPRVAAGSGRFRTAAGGLGAAGMAAKVVLEFAGGDGPFTRALRETVRVKGKGSAQVAYGRNSTPVAVMG